MTAGGEVMGAEAALLPQLLFFLLAQQALIQIANALPVRRCLELAEVEHHRLSMQ